MDFAQQLVKLGAPHLLSELAHNQRQIIKEVLRTEMKGTLTLKITYEPSGPNQVLINADIAPKPPTVDQDKILANVSKSGDITGRSQMSIEDVAS